MSTAPLQCQTCQRECLFERADSFPGNGDEATYGVSWRCPQCQSVQLDVCPVGPLVPTADTCLNCGAEVLSEACIGCGMTTKEVKSYVKMEATNDAISEAQQDFLKGLFRRGIAKLNAAIQQNPNLFEAYEIKAKFFQALRFHNAAKICIQEAIDVGGPLYLKVSLGYILQELGHHEEAIEVYKRFLAISSNGSFAAMACANQANSLVTLNRYQEAEALFQRALSLEPERSLHYYNFSRCLTTQQKWEQALSALNAGLQHCKEEALKVTLLAEKAWVLNELGQAEGALSSAEQCLSLSPKKVKALYHKGRALAFMGQLEEAAKAMQEVLAIDPENADATRALGMITNALRPS